MKVKKILAVTLCLIMSSSVVSFAAQGDVYKSDGTRFATAKEMNISSMKQKQVNVSASQFLYEGANSNLYKVSDAFNAWAFANGDIISFASNLIAKTPVSIVQELQVASIDDVNITTVAGKAPALPATVSAVMSDDTTTVTEVTWDTIDASKYANPGSFTVNGTIAGSLIKAVANVTVTSITARTITVASEGADYTNIQDAVNAAGNGDTILLAEGQYNLTSPIILTGNKVTIVGSDEGANIKLNGLRNTGMFTTIDGKTNAKVVFENINFGDEFYNEETQEWDNCGSYAFESKLGTNTNEVSFNDCFFYTLDAFAFFNGTLTGMENNNKMHVTNSILYQVNYTYIQDYFTVGSRPVNDENVVIEAEPVPYAMGIIFPESSIAGYNGAILDGVNGCVIIRDEVTKESKKLYTSLQDALNDYNINNVNEIIYAEGIYVESAEIINPVKLEGLKGYTCIGILNIGSLENIGMDLSGTIIEGFNIDTLNLYAHGSSDNRITIKDNSFWGSDENDGIRTPSTVSYIGNVDIIGNEFRYTEYGMHFNTLNDALISENTFISSYHGIYLDGYNEINLSKNITIINNEFKTLWPYLGQPVEADTEIYIGPNVDDASLTVVDNPSEY